jgi:hypothetical protein
MRLQGSSMTPEMLAWENSGFSLDAAVRVSRRAQLRRARTRAAVLCSVTTQCLFCLLLRPKAIVDPMSLIGRLLPAYALTARVRFPTLC